jgi:hypothetical protein
MKRYLMPGLMVLALTTPALAADASKHYAVEDTVGNCAVIDAAPAPGLKLLGNKSGYDTIQAAQKAFSSGCKGKVERS